MATEDRRRPLAAFVWAWMPEYRLPFFELLRSRLDELGVDVLLLYGHATGAQALKEQTVDVDWGHLIHNRVLRVRGKELRWLPGTHLLGHADLVVLHQGSHQLLNYVLLPGQLFTKTKVALWGHGRNFGEDPSTLGELVKRLVTRSAHWCFAYNDLSARAFRELGVSDERLTVVQNAVDTRALQRARRELSSDAVRQARRDLGLQGDNVAVFCGGLYPAKRPEFLVTAAEQIRAEVPDFELIVIGSGESRAVIERAADAHPWLHYVGPKFGDDKVPYFALSKVFLMSGLVGLAVLDSFALEVPMVASSSVRHSPEVDYLRNGENGLLVDDGGDPARYAKGVVEILRDEPLRQRLVAGCQQAQSTFTIEAMAENFAQGVVRALAS